MISGNWLAYNYEIYASDPCNKEQTQANEQQLSHMNNPNAARARKVALDRHRMQLRLHRIGILLALIAGIVAGRQEIIRTTDWRGGPPPPITKVKVVTYGFMDKEGVWRSYDNGEKITVTNWKP